MKIFISVALVVALLLGALAFYYYSETGSLNFKDMELFTLKQSLKMNPSNKQGWRRLIFLYHKHYGIPFKDIANSTVKTYPKDFVAAYEKLAELTPTDHLVLMTLRLMYTQNKQYDKAIKILEQAIETDAREYKLNFFLAETYFQKAKMEAHANSQYNGSLNFSAPSCQKLLVKAEKALKQFLKRKPKYDEGWFLLKDIYSAQGKTEAAQEIRDMLLSTHH